MTLSDNRSTPRVSYLTPVLLVQCQQSRCLPPPLLLSSSSSSPLWLVMVTWWAHTQAWTSSVFWQEDLSMGINSTWKIMLVAVIVFPLQVVPFSWLDSELQGWWQFPQVAPTTEPHTPPAPGGWRGDWLREYPGSGGREGGEPEDRLSLPVVH